MHSISIDAVVIMDTKYKTHVFQTACSSVPQVDTAMGGALERSQSAVTYFPGRGMEPVRV